jgi:hypothetical protein
MTEGFPLIYELSVRILVRLRCDGYCTFWVDGRSASGCWLLARVESRFSGSDPETIDQSPRGVRQNRTRFSSA